MGDNVTTTTLGYPLVMNTDSTGAAWTTSTIGTMQIGYALTTSHTDAIAISTLWAYIDYVPTVLSGRLVTMGFELGTLTAGVEITGHNFTSGTASTISTAVVRSGSTYSALYHLTSSSTSNDYIEFTTGGNGTIYGRCYFYLTGYPSSNSSIMGAGTSSSPLGGAFMNSSGQIGVVYYVSGTVTYGTTLSSAVSLNTWHYIEIEVAATTNNSQSITARLDGTTIATQSGSRTFTANTINWLVWGVFGQSGESGTIASMYVDDIALNTGDFGLTQNTWVGASNLAIIRPNAAGLANTFGTQVGGTAGSSNNYTRVDEVTPDNATSYNASNTLGATDLFGVSSSPYIVSGTTINVVQVGGVLANITAADATTALEFLLESGSNIYPSSAIIPDSTSWLTDAATTTVGYPLTLTTDPTGAVWTYTSLAAMQIGYLLAASHTDSIGVSTVWSYADYLSSVPNAPTLNSPSNGASTYDTTPTLEFTGTDPNGDLLAYEVEIDTNSSFTSYTPAKVQDTTGSTSSSGSSLTTTAFASSTTSGNTIIVSIATYSTTVSSVTDSKSNTYTLITSSNYNGSAYVYMYYAYNITGGSSHTVTANLASTGSDVTIIAREVSGLGIASSPLDKSHSASGSSTSPASGSTATTTQAVEYVIGMAANWGGDTYTVGSGYGDLKTDSAVSDTSMAIEDLVTSTTGAQNATFTQSSSWNWGAIVATFEASVPSVFISGTNAGFADVTHGSDTNPFPSGDQISYTVQTALATGLTYYWQVRAIDPGGSNTYGSWSSTYSFTVSTASPPNTPTLISPSNGGTVSTLTPTLEFSDTSTTGSGLNYQLALSSTSGVLPYVTPAKVQDTTGSTSSSGTTLTTSAFSSATTIGNLIVVAIAVYSGTVSSVSDNYNNTYSSASGGNTSSNSEYIYIYYAYGITGGSGHTVTVTLSTTGLSAGIIAREVSGVLNTATPFDQQSSSFGTSSTPSTGTTSTTTQSVEYVFGVTNNSSGATNTAGTGYGDINNDNAAAAASVSVEDLVTSSTGVQGGTFNQSANVNWIGMIATFKAAPVPIYISATSGTNAGFADVTNNGDTSPFPSGDDITYSIQFANTLLNSTTYYWQVRAIDPGGSDEYSSWSSTYSFTTSSVVSSGRLISIGFELDDFTAEDVSYDTSTGYTAPTLSTAQAHGGSYSAAFHTTTSSWSIIYATLTPTSLSVTYSRIYFYFTGYPSSNSTLMSIINNNDTIGGIYMNSSGQLGTTYCATSSNTYTYDTTLTSAVSLNTWHYLELELITEAVNSQTVSTRLDGTAINTITGTGVIGVQAQQALDFGQFSFGNEAGTMATMYVDDVVANTNIGTVQNTWAGPGYLVAVLPNAAGDSNTFGTQVGGTAGSANNYTRVDGIPPDNGTTYNASNTLGASDLFRVGSSGITTGFTINLVQVGGVFANITTADPVTAFTFQIEKASSGTIYQSSYIIPDSTTWNEQQTTYSAAPPITLNTDPTGAAWNTTTIGTIQIGYTIAASGSTSAGVSSVWAYIDYSAGVVIVSNGSTLLTMGVG